MYSFLIVGTMLLIAIIVTTAAVAVPTVANSDGTTSLLADQLDSELTFFQPLPAIIVPSIPDTTPEPVVSVASSQSNHHRGNNATSHEPIQSVKRGDH
ncbi:hypothetical protein MMC29_002905 [Sticta canariensis]|nr:hypothetical protein [Sticta canariensis]